MPVAPLRLIRRCFEFAPQAEYAKVPPGTRGVYVLYKRRWGTLPIRWSQAQIRRRLHRTGSRRRRRRPPPASESRPTQGRRVDAFLRLRGVGQHPRRRDRGTGGPVPPHLPLRRARQQVECRAVLPPVGARSPASCPGRLDERRLFRAAPSPTRKVVRGRPRPSRLGGPPLADLQSTLGGPPVAHRPARPEIAGFTSPIRANPLRSRPRRSTIRS